MYKKIKRNYKVTSNDKLIIVDTSIDNVNLTFDKEKSYFNEIIIKKVTSDSNKVLVDVASEIITLLSKGESVRVISFDGELFPIKSNGTFPKKTIDLKYTSDKIKLQNESPFDLGGISIFEKSKISDGLSIKIKDFTPNEIIDLYNNNNNFVSAAWGPLSSWNTEKPIIGVAFWGMPFPDTIKANGELETDPYKDVINGTNQFFKPRKSYLMNQAYADKMLVVKDNTSKAVLYQLKLKDGPVNYLKEIDYSQLTIDESSGLTPTTVKVALLNTSKTKFYYKNAGVWASLSTTSSVWASALVNNASLQKLSDVRTPGYFNGLPEYLTSIGYTDSSIFLGIANTAGTYPMDTAKPIIKSDRFLCMYNLTKASELEELFVFDDSDTNNDIGKVVVKIVASGVGITNNAVVYRGGIWQNIQEGQPWMTLKEIKSIPKNAWKQLDSYLNTIYNVGKKGYNGGLSLIFKFPYIAGVDTTTTIGGLFAGVIKDKFKLLDNDFETADGIVYEKVVTPSNYLVSAPEYTEIIKEAIHIKTVEDFLNIGVLYPRNGYFILDNDLDFSELTDIPYVPFSGNFDGNYKAIKNLKIHRIGGDSPGIKGSSLFSLFIDAPMKPVIANLTLDNWDINVHANFYCLCDHLDQGAIIDNCHVTNSKLATSSGYELAGLTYNATKSSQILNCTVENTTLICDGSVGSVAGLVAFIYDAIVKNSFVINCTVSAGGQAGGLFTGLVGAPIIVENCMAIDTTVIGKSNDTFVGGITAASWHVLNMYNCAFIGGSITGKDYTGGLTAEADSLYSIENIVIATTIVGTGSRSEIITDSVWNADHYGGYGVPSIYYDSDIAGTLPQNFTGITAATTAQMKSKAFWQDKLDPEVWDLVDGEYPKIKKDAKSFIL